jgi:hypothetical protein
MLVCGYGDGTFGVGTGTFGWVDPRNRGGVDRLMTW